MRLILTVILAATLLSPAAAQTPQTPPPRAIAATYCLGDRVSTWINVVILDTDSLKEILIHETVHRRQALDTVTAVGRCPRAHTQVDLLLAEIEAFCVSFDERTKRMLPQQARADYIGKLLRYPGGVPPDSVLSFWQERCGK